MTTKNSICIKCEYLDAITGARCFANGEASLISTCFFGGRNSGNRKTCKKFFPANERKIAERRAALERETNDV